MTPEGRVKQAIKSVLDRLKPDLWYWMPVPFGYGSSVLDFVVCYRGRLAMIEAKAPGKSMTPRQELVAAEVRAAGGVVFEIDGLEGLKELQAWLNQ